MIKVKNQVYLHSVACTAVVTAMMCLQISQVYADCPAGTQLGKVTGKGVSEIQRQLIQVMLSKAEKETGHAFITQVIQSSNFSLNALKDLLEQFQKRVLQGSPIVHEQEIYDTIVLAIHHSENQVQKIDEGYFCTPNNPSPTHLGVAGNVAMVDGQLGGEVGPTQAYMPDKITVNFDQSLMSQNRLRITYNLNTTPWTIQNAGSTTVLKTSTITKSMPSTDIENPEPFDERLPFTEGFTPGSPTPVGIIASDVISLDPYHQRKLILQFGMTDQTSVGATYRAGFTQLDMTAYSAAAANPNLILPVDHTIDSWQARMIEGIGYHFEVGGAIRDQNTFQTKNKKITTSMTQFYTAWLRNYSVIGKGILDSRTAVNVQTTPNSDQLLGAILEELTFVLAKNRFIGEAVVMQQTPGAVAINLKPESPLSPQTLGALTIGYERKLYSKGSTFSLYMGGAYIYTLAPQSYFSQNNGGANAAEIHLRVFFRHANHWGKPPMQKF